MLKLISKTENFKIRKDPHKLKISNLDSGINILENYFIKKSGLKIDWVTDRVCDHNFGKLIVNNKKNKNLAVCPMHNWKLDLKTLKYKNINVKKKKIKFKIKNNEIIIFDSSHKVDFSDKLLKKIDAESNFKDIDIRYLSHASVQILHNDTRIITDPWFFGPAFSNGWWLRKSPSVDVSKIIDKVNYLYISHNHPDHLHIETLNKFDKNITVITPNFKSKSTYKLLNRIGFKKIFLCDFNKIYKLKDKNIYFTLFKSGDFKDDSGIYFNINKRKILLNVDCNNLNGGALPNNIDVLLSSYAGGASGFPLCFEDYTEIDKELILNRNKKAQFAMVLNLIKKTNAKYFIPYAGFFSESAPRDKYILTNNKKNNFNELSEYVRKTKMNVKLVNFEKNDTIRIVKSSNKFSVLNQNSSKKLYNINKKYISKYLEFTKKQYLNKDFENKIIKYFNNSKFIANIRLFIILTNDNFSPKENGYLVNFEKNNFYIEKKSNHLLEEYFNNYNQMKITRFLMIKVREESFNKVITEKLPWEDLLIGFQCKIKRKPNIYNNDFWNYFTNEYIDNPNYRYQSPCNQCDLLLQNIF